MRRRIFVFMAVLCLALPLLAADKSATSGFGAVRFSANSAPEPINALSFGVSNTSTGNTGGGGGAGKAIFDKVVFKRPLSKSSKSLFESCANGQHFQQVSFDLFDGKGNKIAQVVLTDALISSYIVAPVDSTGIIGPSDTPVPTETVSLEAAKIEYAVLIGL